MGFSEQDLIKEKALKLGTGYLSEIELVMNGIDPNYFGISIRHLFTAFPFGICTLVKSTEFRLHFLSVACATQIA